MTRDIKVGSKTVKMKASAATPRLYRVEFNRDIFSDMQKMQTAVEQSDENASLIPVEMLTTFENVAYIMAKQANEGKKFPKIDEWLDSFEMFNIYEALPQIIELWGENKATASNSKKNKGDRPGNKHTAIFVTVS